MGIVSLLSCPKGPLHPTPHALQATPYALRPKCRGESAKSPLHLVSFLFEMTIYQIRLLTTGKTTREVA
ncbi:MAG: hypothetical protein F6J93_39755 [Oscillatoria sp. SIO1A7]|nr:hypothetical protein [Oscillatoria sp. SIO1A7]